MTAQCRIWSPVPHPTCQVSGAIQSQSSLWGQRALCWLHCRPFLPSPHSYLFLFHRCTSPQPPDINLCLIPPSFGIFICLSFPSPTSLIRLITVGLIWLLFFKELGQGLTPPFAPGPRMELGAECPWKSCWSKAISEQVEQLWVEMGVSVSPDDHTAPKRQCLSLSNISGPETHVVLSDEKPATSSAQGLGFRL